MSERSADEPDHGTADDHGFFHEPAHEPAHEPDHETAYEAERREDGAHEEPLDAAHVAAEEDDGFFGGAERERRRRRMGGLKSCLALLVVGALLVAGGVAAFTFGRDKLDSLMADAPDFEGPGSGKVLFQVKSGESVTQMGRNLKKIGVVKSVDAFNEAAVDNDKSQDIQVGYYQLKKEMAAADALDVLVDPDNLVQSSVTVPEGLRAEEVLKLVAKKTDLPLRKLKRASRNAKAIGLPSYAKGNVEGYLFPATYAFPPGTTPVSALRTMVDRWRQAADDADLEGSAEKLGYTPGELMTIASLVESEANRDQDRGKVARVIYNRLETDATNKLLQIDATVNYALGRDLGLGLTTEDLDVDSPYNTRKFPGLPPGPIEAPGDEAIDAAAHPTKGDWVYYVTVNLDTGETRFTDDYNQFLDWKNNDLADFCAKSDRC